MALAESWLDVRGAHIQAFTFVVSRSRSVARRARKHVRRNHLVWTPFDAIALPFSQKKTKIIWESWARHTERRQRTRETTGRHHTHGTTGTCDNREQNVMLCIFDKTHRSPAPYTRRRAMQRSNLVMGGADAGAGGMSISSSSGGASDMGASSSPSVASAHGPVHGVLGSGLRFDVPGEELAFGVELGGVSDGSFELVVAVCSQATPSCRPRQVLLA